MSAVQDRRCPNCGEAVPSEFGQHADSLVSSTATCPHCGASVTLEDDAQGQPSGDVERAAGAPPGRSEHHDGFSGHDNPEDVADELRGRPT